MIQIVDTDERYIESFNKALGSVAREKLFLSWTDGPSIESTKAFITDNVRNHIPQVFAVENGNVIGWCDICPRTKQTEKHCGILGMGIIKEYRGMGIGTQLIKAAIDKAKAFGLERVELEVFESNRVAQKLYEKMDFKIEGIRNRAFKIDGNYINTILMYKYI